MVFSCPPFRRYKILQRLIHEGEYFSDENMQLRQPTLYHTYVGRFKNGEPEKEFMEGTPLYERLLHDVDLADAERRRQEEAGIQEVQSLTATTEHSLTQPAILPDTCHHAVPTDTLVCGSRCRKIHHQNPRLTRYAP